MSDLGGLATPPSRAPSATRMSSRRSASPSRSASARGRAPSEAGADEEDGSGSRRGRHSCTLTPTQQPWAGTRESQPVAPPGLDCGMNQPAFRAVLDWWENAAAVLGVAGGTVTQSEVEERLERASGMPPGRASLAEPVLGRQARQANGAGGPASEDSPPQDTSGRRALRPARVQSQVAEDKGAASAEDRDGGGIPGLDFIYRLMAPRHLMERYEQLEHEVESPQFKEYSPEEQAELRQQLQETQAAIEQRENRLNIAAAAVGGLHGAYVGTMAAMLAIFVPQKCPPTATNPTIHTCNIYDNITDLTPFNKAVLALNAFTLIMMLLTEYSVFRRETWLDTTLSYNPRKAARHLSMPAPDGGPSLLQRHPYIAHQLLWQNLTAGNLARATIAMVLVNLLASSVLIIGFYNDGARSVITIITNTLLLGAKLLWAAVICLQSKNNQQGVSLYKTMRINFNIIDANFLASEGARRLRCHIAPPSQAALSRRVRAVQRQVHVGAGAGGVRARGHRRERQHEGDGVAGEAGDQAHRGGPADDEGPGGASTQRDERHRRRRRVAARVACVARDGVAWLGARGEERLSVVRPEEGVAG